mmetsp:Transcript_38083/g.84834  ORF Transcript_38083/g.84834 Transcript_38083/m.84834 type:complete len:374 (+) Transcript_38083:240-1361(+)
MRAVLRPATTGSLSSFLANKVAVRVPYSYRHALRNRDSSVRCSAGLLTSTETSVLQQQEYSTGKFRSLSSADLEDENPLLAYEVVQGPLVRWTRKSNISTPTAVLVHGILGSRRNMQSFARRIVEGFPSWQVLMVDLRCHGESASLAGRPEGPHSLAAASDDVLAVLNHLKLFPTVLIGHSFGGKVVMGMVQRFGSRLPRPVQVWVLDSLPGEVRSGQADGRDHPARLIQTLREMPLPIASRGVLTAHLESQGFSKAVAQWAATSLRPLRPSEPSGPLTWIMDLDGIQDLYSSYESTSLWPLLEAPPQGLKLDFVKAERSTFRWGAGGEEDRITSLGHQVHLLTNSGHWVHADNPVGLYSILSPSFTFQQSRR